jgi:hypothetical protein
MAGNEEKPQPGMGYVDTSLAPGYQPQPPLKREGGTGLASLSEGIPLSTMLEQLADELRAVQLRGRGDDKQDIVRVKECTLEVGLTWELEGTAGVKFLVFELGGSYTKANSQTLTVTLEPLTEREITFATMDPAEGISKIEITRRGLPTEKERAEQ